MAPRACAVKSGGLAACAAPSTSRSRFGTNGRISRHLVVERMEPPRGTRLRGPIQCPLELTRLVAGVLSQSGIHRRFPPLGTQTECGSFPPPWFCCHGLTSTMSRSDSRSALPHFTVVPLIGLDAPRPPRGRHPRGLTAGAETGLSCSHDGCASVPRPLRRGVLRGCSSKRLTPSVGFAQDTQLGSPLAPRGAILDDAAGFAPCCGPLACTLPRRARPALRRPGLPKRRRAATKVAWSLLWPDLHRLVVVSFQDARILSIFPRGKGVGPLPPSPLPPGLASHDLLPLVTRDSLLATPSHYTRQGGAAKRTRRWRALICP